MSQKPIIYQLLPRLFGNLNPQCVPSGTIGQNGSGKFNSITPAVIKSIKQLGHTHLWLTGVIEHAQCTDYTSKGIMPPDNPHVVKGQAGSPYAIKDYYDVDPDLAVDVPRRIEEFEALVGRIHAQGMKVIIDFVPNHVARQYHSDSAPADAPADLGAADDVSTPFSSDNNFYYLPSQEFAPYDVELGSGADAYHEYPAKATGNDCFTATPGRCDWYETVKLNYGVDYRDGSRHFDPIPSTWHKMLHILLFWAAKGVDGFRCDMAHMVPLEFWHWAIAQVKNSYPDIIFIAEIYDVGLYRDYIYIGGFDYLYDKVNLYDKLRYIQTANHAASDLSGCWQAIGDIESHMLNFLENHDEQRYASRQYAGDAARVTPALVVASTIGTGAMMVYAGQELGERAEDAEGFSGLDGRTTIFDYWSVPTLRRWLLEGRPLLKHLSAQEKQLRSLYSKILNISAQSHAITRGRMFDLMYVNYSNPSVNPHRHFAYLRGSDRELLLIAVNFSGDHADMAINIPAHAFQFFNIDAGNYLAIELLSGQKSTVTLMPDGPFRTPVPPEGAVIWKLSAKRTKNSMKTS